MSDQGTYYVGRVLKLGSLNQTLLMAAIMQPGIFAARSTAWTFTEMKESQIGGHKFITGKLCKYSPVGEITVIDPEAHYEITRDQPNLELASSPFIYIPEHSGISFLAVPGQIDQSLFIKRFCQVIEKTFDNMFVSCEIKLISDLKTFSLKLLSLDHITQIKANVSPPNPLFGRSWRSLKEYLERRNAEKMLVAEAAPNGKKLLTSLPETVKAAVDAADAEDASDTTTIGLAYSLDNAFSRGIAEPLVTDISGPTPIGDAAVLMAADGYGKGYIRGERDGHPVVIRTDQTALNFQFDKEPGPMSLFEKVWGILEKIRTSRHMEHGE